MSPQLHLPPADLPEEAEELRGKIRSFLREERKKGSYVPQCDSWVVGFDPAFSRKLGEQGWIGMTWPREYGGQERSNFERYVVIEELLAAGAPVAAHWIGDRQTGPLLLRYGTDTQKQKLLPPISRGECSVAIGLSEPQAGSDLANIQTRAERVDGDWVLNGRKVWTSGAHDSHYIVVLCRTSPRGEDRHEGMSQLIVDTSLEGLSMRPIRLITGHHHFNEVIFDDVRVPGDMLIGEEGNGWEQVISELAYERSGPERFLSTFPLLEELVRVVRYHPSARRHIKLGELISELWTLRQMSISVAAQLDRGEAPETEAALVKDMGTRFEKNVVESARHLIEVQPSLASSSRLNRLLAEGVLQAPGFTLRGGTNEILRGVVARQLGLR